MTLTVSANGGVDALKNNQSERRRRRSASRHVNVMVKALLFLAYFHGDDHSSFHHGCCVLGVRGNLTLIVSANGGVDALKNKHFID